MATSPKDGLGGKLSWKGCSLASVQQHGEMRGATRYSQTLQGSIGAGGLYGNEPWNVRLVVPPPNFRGRHRACCPHQLPLRQNLMDNTSPGATGVEKPQKKKGVCDERPRPTELSIRTRIRLAGSGEVA